MSPAGDPSAVCASHTELPVTGGLGHCLESAWESLCLLGGVVVYFYRASCGMRGIMKSVYGHVCDSGKLWRWSSFCPLHDLLPHIQTPVKMSRSVCDSLLLQM